LGALLRVDPLFDDCGSSSPGAASACTSPSGSGASPAAGTRPAARQLDLIDTVGHEVVDVDVRGNGRLARG
jgi:hypothetical protein